MINHYSGNDVIIGGDGSPGSSSSGNLNVNHDFRVIGNSQLCSKEPYSALQIKNGGVPERRGISIPSDPNGAFNFYIHGYQENAAFHFLNGLDGQKLMSLYHNGFLKVGGVLNNKNTVLQVHSNGVIENAIIVETLNDYGQGSIEFIVKSNGTVYARDIIVTTDEFPDYLFKKEYKLMTLQQLENFINQNGHLPNIPKEAEVKENGLPLGEMNKKLLEKIEELTLYLIQQNKRIEELEKKSN